MHIPELLEKETAGLPNGVWLIVIVAGLGATYIVPKFLGRNSQATSSAQSTGTDTGAIGSTESGTGIGLAVDPTTGLPYAVEGLVPSGGTVGTGIPSGTTNQNTLMSEVGLIRSRDNSALTKQADSKNPGIPIRTSSAAGSGTVGYAPYGSQITVTGPAVTGEYNFPNNKNGDNGSNLWFPVLENGKKGYISAYDFSGSPVQRPVSWPYA